ncbi:hypothetical protein HYFRA_00010784 [Hymenoscyphus fraxineus]|uniref:Uncharacterized protein n=1 Tax=Hymenoscyphus fraxineus TaxID=746836 RepID=A0A9N9L386_9HELO|nr:hypothetical protein HYFRA_00010784 [Hymenoscyphus fraxineus]
MAEDPPTSNKQSHPTPSTPWDASKAPVKKPKLTDNSQSLMIIARMDHPISRLYRLWEHGRLNYMTDRDAQYAIDSGLKIDLQSKIARHFETIPSYGWPRTTATKNLTFFHSWLADGILRLQNKKLNEIADNKKSVQETGKEPRLEELTAAWNELIRVEAFEKSKNENPSFLEFRAVQDFENTKQDNASYQEYLAFQAFQEQGKENDQQYTDFLAFQRFRESVDNNDEIYKQYLAMQRFQRSVDNNDRDYRQYLAMQRFQKAVDNRDEFYKQFLRFETFRRAKSIKTKSYTDFVKFSEFEATMNTNPLVQKMKEIEHIQQLMESSATNAEGPKNV